jgi:hypothetical protein
MAWKCPFCNVPNPDMWNPLCAIHDEKGKSLSEPQKQITNYIRRTVSVSDLGDAVTAQLFWTVCRNDECREIVVMVRHGHHTANRGPSVAQLDMWFAIPKRQRPRPLDPLVLDPYRRDYLEAALILDDSPRMSSVLSRRILQDLLEQFAGRTEYKLEDRIDNFIADTKFPSNIKDNLHHLRDIANFGAHTKKEKATGEIIDVDHDEAEWTLEVVDGLFDYFIVGPAKDQQRRTDWDNKRGQTGSPRPIKKQRP